VNDLVLYTHPMSRGRTARWMLEEVGAPYRAEIVDYGAPMKAAAYRAINPMGKVPALVHRGVVVTECAAICAYLADAFPEKGLAPPPGDPTRGTYWRWLFFGAGPLEAATTTKAMGFVVPPDKTGMAGWGTMDDVVAALESALAAGPYLCGERFTAADVYLGAGIGWTTQFGILPKRPAFEAYVTRISARPSAIRAKEIDDALVPAHPMPGRG
jgi:glutathione S-transferase